jgi:hypothetical protein
MKNLQLLKISIESIKALQLEIHDDIDDSKRKKLDQIVKDLEHCEDQNISANRILELLGKAIDILPAIAKFLTYLG